MNFHSLYFHMKQSALYGGEISPSLGNKAWVEASTLDQFPIHGLVNLSAFVSKKDDRTSAFDGKCTMVLQSVCMLLLLLLAAFPHFFRRNAHSWWLHSTWQFVFLFSPPCLCECIFIHKSRSCAPLVSWENALFKNNCSPFQEFYYTLVCQAKKIGTSQERI